MPCPGPLYTQALRTGVFGAAVLAMATLLAGCPGGDNTPEPKQQLQSITVTDEAGKVLSVSHFDYIGSTLVRVRAYDQPGDDGIVGTADDPLAGGSLGDLDHLLAGGGYTACAVVNEGGKHLHSPYAEQLGDNRLQRLFTAQTDCVLPGQSASRVTSTYITSPGLDGLWFTADDVASYRRILARTPDGSELRQEPLGLPDNTANLNSTGLNNIVYNPYAGLDTTQPIQYGYDNRGFVTTLQSASYTQHFTYADDGVLTGSELILPSSLVDDSNILWPLLQPPTRFREEYTRLDALRSTVEAYVLVDQSAYLELTASPTGQILLAILGPSPAGEVTVDGQVYMRLGPTRYLTDRHIKNVETVTRRGQAGPDGKWFTDDDVIISTATLRYATTN